VFAGAIEQLIAPDRFDFDGSPSNDMDSRSVLDCGGSSHRFQLAPNTGTLPESGPLSHRLLSPTQSERLPQFVRKAVAAAAAIQGASRTVSEWFGK